MTLIITYLLSASVARVWRYRNLIITIITIIITVLFKRSFIVRSLYKCVAPNY